MDVEATQMLIRISKSVFRLGQFIEQLVQHSQFLPVLRRAGSLQDLNFSGQINLHFFRARSDG